MNKLVSIVISAYNERDNLPPLMSQLKEVLSYNSRFIFQVIIVDDGSSDNTVDDVKLLEDTLGRSIDFLKLSKNYGHEIAMKAGLDFSNGDAVVFLDADLQHPPELINKMLLEWEAGKKLVLTRRAKNEDATRLYNILSRLYYKSLHYFTDGALSGHNTPDFRLIDKKYVERLKSYKEKTYFLRGMITLVSYYQDIVWLEFNAPKRLNGVSKYNFSTLLFLALDSLISFSTKPLRLILLLAIFISFLGILFFIFIMCHWFLIGGANYGFYTIVCLIIIFGSLNTLLTAIVGEYVARIHNEVKHRPPYHIEDRKDL